MEPYEAHANITEVLAAIEQLYQNVMDRINRGEQLSAADVRKLAQLSKCAAAARNQEIILNKDTPIAVYAKKWGVSQARVSQIRHQEGKMRKHQERIKYEPVHPHLTFR